VCFRYNPMMWGIDKIVRNQNPCSLPQRYVKQKCLAYFSLSLAHLREPSRTCESPVRSTLHLFVYRVAEYPHRLKHSFQRIIPLPPDRLGRFDLLTFIVMKATHLFLEINKVEFIADKAIRAIEARIEHQLKPQTDIKATDATCSVASKAIGSTSMLRKIATMEGFFVHGMECYISMN
jgi:hypothetical protein